MCVCVCIISKYMNVLYKTTAVSRANIVASHLADPGLIPGWVSFPGRGFFNCKTNVGQT